MPVLIAGAGPAGSRLADLLSGSGIEVTVVERLKNPENNSFSSAVVPINSLTKHCIPLSAVSSYWKTWSIVDPNQGSYSWSSKNKLGAVLDFALLRKLMWSRLEVKGINLMIGSFVKRAQLYDKYVDVEIQNAEGEVITKRVDFLIDATGSSRAIIGKYQILDLKANSDFCIGSGIEWILSCEDKMYKQWENRITFFLGSYWIRNGYGWIFPNGINQLKIGFCRLLSSNINTRFDSENIEALERIIDQFQLDTSKVLDRHGGIIKSYLRRNEGHIFGRIIGVGDCVSTANLLGGEGIRHAFTSAEVLAPLLIEATLLSEQGYLGKFRSLHRYKRKLKNRFGWAWLISNRIARKTWLGLDGKEGDKRISSLIKGLSNRASAEDISALLFDYKFAHYGLRLLPYLLRWK